MRITAQLIEAETDKHVWAERYDRDLVDIFAVQDEITEAVTIAIAPAIAEVERQRAMRKPPGSLDAWAAYAKQAIRDKLIEHREFINRYGDDMPEITGWRWGQEAASAGVRSTEADNI